MNGAAEAAAGVDDEVVAGCIRTKEIFDAAEPDHVLVGVEVDRALILSRDSPDGICRGAV